MVPNARICVLLDANPLAEPHHACLTAAPPDIWSVMASVLDPSPGFEAITVEVEVTLADQIAFNEHLRAQPEIRTCRMRLLTAAILVVPLIAFGAGVVIAHVTGDARASLWTVLGDLPAAAWRDMVMTWLACAGFLAALTAVLDFGRHPLLRWRLRKLLLQRPGVDSADPDLREWARCTFDTQGFATKGIATFTQIDWSIIRGLNETPGLLLLRTGSLAGFILPKHDLSEAQIDDIRRMVLRLAAAPPRPR